MLITDLKLPDEYFLMWKFVDDMTISKTSPSYEGKSFTRCCFNTNNWLKEHSLQLSPTKCSKRTSRKFLKITFHHLSLRLYLTGWYSTELSMQKYSAYEEWWSQVEQSYNTGNFYTAGSCISLIIISHHFLDRDCYGF